MQPNTKKVLETLINNGGVVDDRTLRLQGVNKEDRLELENQGLIVHMKNHGKLAITAKGRTEYNNLLKEDVDEQPEEDQVGEEQSDDTDEDA